MSRYSDQVRDELGRAVPGATVYVYNLDTGALESLTDDASAPLDNPLTTDEFGQFYFNADDGHKRLDFYYGGRVRWKEEVIVGLPEKGDPGGNVMAIGLFGAAAGLTIPVGTDQVQSSGYSTVGRGQALYVYDAAVDAAWVAAHPRAGFLDLEGRGFRLSFSQRIETAMFGAVMDNATLDYPAIAAGIDFISLFPAINAGSVFNWNYGYHPLWISAGGIHYMGANTIDAYKPIALLGSSPGGFASGNCGLRWAGASGIRVHSGDTTGATGVQAVNPLMRGSQLRIENLVLDGSYAGGAEAEYHAIHERGSTSSRNLLIANWAGDGIHRHAELANPAVKGNANSSSGSFITIYNVRNGVYTQGSDANSGTYLHINVLGARQWGFWDSSGLANTYISCLSEGNARSNLNNGVNIPVSFVHHAGKRYFVIPGNEAWASANAPSGTTANNTGWGYWVDGGADASTGIPTWFAGILARGGGGYFIEGSGNGSVLVNPYCESSEINLLDQAAVVFGSVQMDYVWKWSGNTLYGAKKAINGPSTIMSYNEGMELTGDTNVWGRFRSKSGTHIFGGESGSNETYFDSSSVSTNLLVFRSWLAGVNQIDATISSGRAGYLILNHTNSIGFQIAGANSAFVQAFGINLAAGKVLKVNDVQVIGAQGAAVADAAGGATVDTEARAAINALLARLRAHGVIAT